MIFGMTMSNLSIYLKFTMRIFIWAFRDNPLARIAVPDHATIKGYKQSVGERHPFLADVWATMDGLKLSIEKAATDKKQSPQRLHDFESSQGKDEENYGSIHIATG